MVPDRLADGGVPYLPPDTASTDRVHNFRLWTQPGSVSQYGSGWTLTLKLRKGDLKNSVEI